jgi:hypothetical protein
MIPRFLMVCGCCSLLGLVSCGISKRSRSGVSIGRMGAVRTSSAVSTAANPAAPAPAAPTAEVQAPKETVAKKNKSEPADEPMPARNESGGAGDGIRLPNMLGLPADKELKATNPSVPKSGQDGGAVISRPPTEKKE